MVPPAELDGLTHADLKSLVLKLLEQVAELQRTVAAQRDEIARLKGGPGRPNIRPSGMEQATEAKPAGSNRRRPRGGTRSKLSIDEERTVKVAAPPGSRWTTPARATRPPTASARRLAMHTSPGSAPPARRAASTSSRCCAPAMAITSSMPRRWLTCANARWPRM